MNAGDGTHRESTAERSIRFRLSAECAALRADVRLRNAGDRWIADSKSRGRQVTGIGSTARAATVASLGWLGPAAVAELLADLRLLEVSRQLRVVAPL